MLCSSFFISQLFVVPDDVEVPRADEEVVPTDGEVANADVDFVVANAEVGLVQSDVNQTGPCLLNLRTCIKVNIFVCTSSQLLRNYSLVEAFSFVMNTHFFVNVDSLVSCNDSLLSSNR